MHDHKVFNKLKEIQNQQEEIEEINLSLFNAQTESSKKYWRQKIEKEKKKLQKILF